ncbi:MAG: FecR domain-containing protein [Rhodocyclaceae bacterium]|nr:FecR domain-containing protein [Rhodocyclaceae bacterium]MDZ4214246.1 FecR domain-containing protein [Rhodocyclaceae bacterium]
MPPLAFRIKQPGAALMVALSAAFPFTAMAATAGRIDFVVGDVKALAADGRSRPLTKGASFEIGETIETGTGRAQLRFTDGAQVSLQPGSRFRIDDYNFSGKVDGSEKGLFSLLKGGLRTITGLVGRTNRENYKVTTAVATIGIRGTEYSVQYGNSITVTTGEGVIEICNAAGCLILNSGETAYVPNISTQPTMTDKKADVPPPPPESLTLYNASRTSEVPTILSDFPTPASQIATLTGTANFTLSGPSTPSSYTGTYVPETFTSGSLTANFSANPTSVSLSLKSSTLTLSGTGTLTSGTPNFSSSSFSGTGGFCGGSGCTGSFAGTFTGTNASGAIVTYSATQSFNNNSLSGSGAFTRVP